MSAEELRQALLESIRLDPPKKELPMNSPEKLWEDMTSDEQAALHNLWHVDTSGQLEQLRSAVDSITRDTAEVRDLLKDFKGAMRVLEIFGKLAKPLGAIALAITAIAALWHSK